MKVAQKSDVPLIISQVWIMGAIGFNNGFMLVLGVYFIVWGLITAYKGD